jgi:hypothetical protein
MGILEVTCENLTKATEYFEHAIAIRTAAGNPAASLLANSYLGLSRVYFASGESEKAFQLVGKSEALISRTTGDTAPFMAQ